MALTSDLREDYVLSMSRVDCERLMVDFVKTAV